MLLTWIIIEPDMYLTSNFCIEFLLLLKGFVGGLKVLLCITRGFKMLISAENAVKQGPRGPGWTKKATFFWGKNDFFCRVDSLGAAGYV